MGGGGSGLGLAIVAAIVSRHDGRVGIAATPGGGATFVVSLPLTHLPDDAPEDAEEQAPEHAGDGDQTAVGSVHGSTEAARSQQTPSSSPG